MKKISLEESVFLLQTGHIGVMPTDTIYGVVGSTKLPDTVERVYDVRGRSKDKPCIILVPTIEDIMSFEVAISDIAKKAMYAYWPGPVSIILPSKDDGLAYLHRGKKSLAFRVPADENFRIFLRKTGPLIAPSANTEGNKPATTIEEAYAYFSDTVDFYVDGGPRDMCPSTVVSAKDGSISVVREGMIPLGKIE